MKKNKYLWGDFDHLVATIKNRTPLTEEEKVLWKQFLKQIEESIDKPTTGTDIRISEKGYKLIDKKDDIFGERKPSLIRRFKNWLITLLEEKEA